MSSGMELQAGIGCESADSAPLPSSAYHTAAVLSGRNPRNSGVSPKPGTVAAPSPTGSRGDLPTGTSARTSAPPLRRPASGGPDRSEPLAGQIHSAGRDPPGCPNVARPTHPPTGATPAGCGPADRCWPSEGEP